MALKRTERSTGLVFVCQAPLLSIYKVLCGLDRSIPSVNYLQWINTNDDNSDDEDDYDDNNTFKMRTEIDKDEEDDDDENKYHYKYQPHLRRPITFILSSFSTWKLNNTAAIFPSYYFFCNYTLSAFLHCHENVT